MFFPPKPNCLVTRGILIFPNLDPQIHTYLFTQRHLDIATPIRLSWMLTHTKSKCMCHTTWLPPRNKIHTCAHRDIQTHRKKQIQMLPMLLNSLKRNSEIYCACSPFLLRLIWSCSQLPVTYCHIPTLQRGWWISRGCKIVFYFLGDTKFAVLNWLRM